MGPGTTSSDMQRSSDGLRDASSLVTISFVLPSAVMYACGFPPFQSAQGPDRSFRVAGVVLPLMAERVVISVVIHPYSLSITLEVTIIAAVRRERCSSGGTSIKPFFLSSLFTCFNHGADAYVGQYTVTS